MSYEAKAPLPYVSLTKLKRLYLDEFVPAIKLAGNEQVLLDALAMMANQGEMITTASEIVYLHPTHMLRHLQPLTDERMGNRLWQSRTLNVADAVRQIAAGNGLRDFERQRAVLAAERFQKEGVLCEELLPVMWEPLGLKQDVYGDYLVALASAGHIFLADKGHAGRRWVMPMRLPFKPPDQHLSRWQAATKAKGAEVLQVVVAAGEAPVPSLFGRVLSACAGLGSFEYVWRDGAYLDATMLGDAPHVLFEFRARARPDAPAGAAAPPEAEICCRRATAGGASRCGRRSPTCARCARRCSPT